MGIKIKKYTFLTLFILLTTMIEGVTWDKMKRTTNS